MSKELSGLFTCPKAEDEGAPASGWLRLLEAEEGGERGVTLPATRTLMRICPRGNNKRLYYSYSFVHN
jgi:hypothetical protein